MRRPWNQTPPEIKDKARELWLAGTRPTDIVAEMDIDHSTFCEWQKAWKAEGLTPGLPPRNQVRSPEVQEKALNLWYSGLSIKALANLIEIPHTTVANWKKSWLRQFGDRTKRIGEQQTYSEAVKERVRADWHTGVLRRDLARRHQIPLPTVHNWVKQWRNEEAGPDYVSPSGRRFDSAFREAAKAEWLACGLGSATAAKMGVSTATISHWISDWRAQGLVPAAPKRTVTDRDIRRGRVTPGPLPGAELPWKEWVATHAAESASAPLADHHIRAWEWFEALESGVRPPALIECWPRGGGKSTTVELALARQAVKGERHFALYVSATQAAANRHVQAVALTMEKLGIRRALNKYGHSLGWRPELLRTANGFNLLALGLDAAVRGIKLDAFRPDIVVLDDIDALADSSEEITRKLSLLRHSLLPAGSSDVAVAFVQNAIHSKSIMTGCLEDTVDLLRRRMDTTPVQAIEGLQVEQVYDRNEPTGYRITGGVATWEGKPLEACEAEINDTGLIAFLRECQHQTAAGGNYFEEWDEKRHVLWDNETDIRRAGLFVGGYDWGYASPACFLLGAVDRETGAITIVDEVYQRRLTNPEQAQEVLGVLDRWGISRDRISIYADPSMWAKKTDHAGRSVADVEAFHRLGLRFVKATNSRRAGWQNVRRYLREAPGSPHPRPAAGPSPSPNHPLTRVPGQGVHRLLQTSRPVATRESEQFLAHLLQALRDSAHGKPLLEPRRSPALLRILKGRCPNLIRTFPLQSVDPANVEDLDTTGEDHALDALRYLLSSRPRALTLALENPVFVRDHPFPGEPHYLLTPDEQMATHPGRYEFAPYGHPDYKPPWLRKKKKPRKL